MNPSCQEVFRQRPLWLEQPLPLIVVVLPNVTLLGTTAQRYIVEQLYENNSGASASGFFRVLGTLGFGWFLQVQGRRFRNAVALNVPCIGVPLGLSKITCKLLSGLRIYYIPL